MDFADAVLYGQFLGKPHWMWLAFIAIVTLLLVLDLGVLNKRPHEIQVGESLVLSAAYIGFGVLFGAGVWWSLGAQSGMEYLTGFAVEKALAMDNVFVIAMIFAFFAVPPKYQHRVLFLGILGVIVLRAIMIGLGASIASQFSWVLYCCCNSYSREGDRPAYDRRDGQNENEGQPCTKLRPGGSAVVSGKPKPLSHENADRAEQCQGEEKVKDILHGHRVADIPELAVDGRQQDGAG